MRQRLHRVAKLLSVTVEMCQRDNTPLLAAGLAFYTLLSLAPALWVVVAMAGSLFGRESVRTEVISFVAGATSARMAHIVSGVLDSVAANSSAATVVGVVSMFFGASIVFSALQDIVNQVWRVPRVERGYVRDFLIKRLLSFTAVVVVGGLVVISLLVGTVTSAAARFVPERLPAPEALLQALDFAISLAWMILLLAVIYRFLPDRAIQWRDVWVGATVTSLLFDVGKTLITLYLGHASLSSLYGTAGSLVVLLLWVYYSAQIFLFGAELTKVYSAGHHTSRSIRQGIGHVA